MIAERDALQGGQFWIGGTDDEYGHQFEQEYQQELEQQQPYEPLDGFDPNIDPLLQELDYQGYSNTVDQDIKEQAPLGYITPTEERKLSDAADNAELDKEEMGLLGLQSVDVRGGITWDHTF